MVVIVFGVAGVGKTTIGKLLAESLGWKFYDADDFHPAANIQKMKSGVALTDQDRQPWLEAVRTRIKQSLTADEDAVLACSALKRRYRDLLRADSGVRFVFLRADRQTIAEHLKRRREHFFHPQLLESQFADLEEPTPDEGVLTVEIGAEPRESAEKIIASLRGSRQ